MRNCDTTVHLKVNTLAGVFAASVCKLVFSGVGGFLPAVKQIGNVAALPGIVGVRPP